MWLCSLRGMGKGSVFMYEMNCSIGRTGMTTGESQTPPATISRAITGFIHTCRERAMKFSITIAPAAKYTG